MKYSKYLAIILFLIQTATWYSCKKEDSDDELIEFVWNYSASHPDGFTLDLQSRKSVTSGIVVAYEATQNSFGKESLSAVIEHALSHDKRVGGWFNTEDQNYYFDSDRVFADGMYTEAIVFARENNQLAIYDITNDSVIWIEYPKSNQIKLPWLYADYWNIRFMPGMPLTTAY